MARLLGTEEHALSRLALKLEDDIRLAETEHASLVGRLRLAGYWARTGHLEKASRATSEVRRRSMSSIGSEILALLNLTESLLEFHKSNLPGAIDKVRRSIAIARTSGGHSQIISAASAWSAHYYRNTGNWSELIDAVEICIHEMFREDYESGARLALVLADSFLEIGKVKASESWYRISRISALHCGDEALIASLIHNRSVLRVYNLRLREISGEPLTAHECRFELEEDSARNYNAYTHNDSMIWMLDLLRGQLLAVQGKWEDAMEALERVDDKFLLPGWPHLKAIRDADVAYCLANLGGVSALITERLEFPRSLLGDLSDPGDAALVAQRVAATMELIGRGGDEFRSAEKLKYSEYLQYCRINSERLAASLNKHRGRLSELFDEELLEGELW